MINFKREKSHFLILNVIEGEKVLQSESYFFLKGSERYCFHINHNFLDLSSHGRKKYQFFFC